MFSISCALLRMSVIKLQLKLWTKHFHKSLAATFDSAQICVTASTGGGRSDKCSIFASEN